MTDLEAELVEGRPEQGDDGEDDRRNRAIKGRMGPPRVPAKIIWITFPLAVVYLLAIALGVFAAIYVGFFGFGGAGAPPNGGYNPGCVSYNDTVSTTPGRVETVDAEVAFGECPKFDPDQVLDQIDEEEVTIRNRLYEEELQRGGDVNFDKIAEEARKWRKDRYEEILQSRKAALVGDRVRLELVSPLFDGDIKPISQEIQSVARADDKGTWSWQLRPNTPGDYHVSLVLSVLKPDNEEVEVQNKRIDITVHVAGTFSYYAGAIWSGLSAFFTSLLGLALSALGVISAVFGVLSQMRKNKKEAEEAKKAEKAKEVATAPSASDTNPYM